MKNEILIVKTKDLVKTSYNKDGEMVLTVTNKESYIVRQWGSIMLSMLNKGLSKDQTKIVKEILLK